jgi:hypothetical protein
MPGQYKLQVRDLLKVAADKSAQIPGVKIEKPTDITANTPQFSPPGMISAHGSTTFFLVENKVLRRIKNKDNGTERWTALGDAKNFDSP